MGTGCQLPSGIQGAAFFKAAAFAVGDGEGDFSVHGDSGVSSVFGHDVEIDAEIRSAFAITKSGFSGSGDATQDFHTSFFRGCALPHEFNSGEGGEILQVGFSASGAATAADGVVHIEPRSNNGAVTNSTGNLERHAAGGGGAGQVGCCIQGAAVNGTGGAPEP